MTPHESFRDLDNDDFDDLVHLSDADLERLMATGSAAAARTDSAERLEPGARVEGVVIDVRPDEVLVELDGKTLGVIDREEYDDAPDPSVGERVQAELVGWDNVKEAYALTTRAVRTEVSWEALRAGATVQGTVVDSNKGGLVVDIKGIRAFLPASQIDLVRVEDLTSLVGEVLTCEVQQVDRAERNLVVSRRVILERESEARREKALARLREGEVVQGTVARLTPHGAFVDLGGVDGLLHASKFEHAARELAEGDQIEVEVVRIDRDRGRIALDFRQIEDGSWSTMIEGYDVGESVTGWISREEPRGLVLSLEEGVEALVPLELLAEREERPSLGALLTGTIVSIDPSAREIRVRPG